MDPRRVYMQLTKHNSNIQLNKEYISWALTLNAHVTEIGLLYMSLSENYLQISDIK
jgi:hypothetical protein